MPLPLRELQTHLSNIQLTSTSILLPLPKESDWQSEMSWWEELKWKRRMEKRNSLSRSSELVVRFSCTQSFVLSVFPLDQYNSNTIVIQKIPEVRIREHDFQLGDVQQVFNQGAASTTRHVNLFQRKQTWRQFCPSPVTITQNKWVYASTLGCSSSVST